MLSGLNLRTLLKEIIFGKLGDPQPVIRADTGAPGALARPDGSLYLRDDAPDPDHVAYVRQGGAWIPLAAVGGTIPAGAPDALIYYDPTGTTLDTNPAFVAGSVDAFGRPQIWDHRFTARGAVWRQGAWQADGDAVSVKSEGVVSYGSNATDAGPSPTDGGFFFETPHSFGQYQIRNGVNGNNLFPVCAWEDGSADAPGIGPANRFVLYTDTNVETFGISRLTGTFHTAGVGQFAAQAANPGALGGIGQYYTKVDPLLGTVEAFYEDDAGAPHISQLTPLPQLYKFAANLSGVGIVAKFYFADFHVTAIPPGGAALQYPIMLDARSYELRAHVVSNTTAVGGATINIERNGVILASVALPVAPFTGDLAIARAAQVFGAGVDHVDVSASFPAGENGKAIISAMVLLR